ncbi:hypothetical protein HK405_009653, partial [Cladochytrium tenue]
MHISLKTPEGGDRVLLVGESLAPPPGLPMATQNDPDDTPARLSPGSEKRSMANPAVRSSPAADSNISVLTAVALDDDGDFDADWPEAGPASTRPLQLTLIAGVADAGMDGFWDDDDETASQFAGASTPHESSTGRSRGLDGDATPYEPPQYLKKGGRQYSHSTDSSGDDWSDSFNPSPATGPAFSLQALRRFQESPTPSSSASVVASEGEDEGFDDLDFPSDSRKLRLPSPTEALARQGGEKPGKPVPVENSKRALPAAQKRNLTDYKDDAANNAESIEIPENFTWRNPALCIPTASQPVASVFPSRIPVRRAAVTSQTKLSGRLPTLCMRTISTSSTANGASTPIIVPSATTQTFYGNGTELDDIDDLPTEPIQKRPSQATVAAAQTGASNNTTHQDPLPKSHHVRPHFKASDGSEKGGFDIPASTKVAVQQRVKKMPTLIRNMNRSDEFKVVGNMRYDPVNHRWDGNEEEALEFESRTSRPAKPRAKPALITNKGMSNKVALAIGTMIFDPVKMCWIGNEDDNVFADFSDDEAMNSAEKPCFFELTVSSQLMRSFHISETAHKLFLGNWYPKAVSESRYMIRDTSKIHLYDIRS